MDLNEIIYLLTIEDIQTVANKEIGRELTADEIGKVKDLVGSKISWYDAINESINQIIEF